MNVVPQNEEVWVMQSVLGGDPAPGVVLQKNKEPVRSSAGESQSGASVSYQQQRRQQIDPLSVQPDKDRAQPQVSADL